MQKKGELSTVGKSMFIKSILSLFFFFLLDYLFENVVFSLVAYLFINLLVLIFYDIKKSKYIFSKQTKALSYMKIFRNCFAYFILSFLVNYVYNIPRYVLDINMAPNFQGIFGIIVMPVSVLLLIVQFIIQPQIVNMTKYYESDFPNFKLLIRKIINLVLVFSLISLIAAYFIGIPFLNSIYNVNLDEYKLEFIICLIGGIFYLIVFILLNPLTIMRKGKAQMIIYIINGFISIILSILLISRYLFSGAVISYSVTMILLSVSYCLYYLYMVRGEKV
ncbi:MAG: hypothetical protein PHT75_02285 [Bacilli bacterium]|nr:hypothetical protein [Bacilli bacterium]